MLRLEDDHYCCVCGRDNPHGLRLTFKHPEKGRLGTEVVFEKRHQGFKEIVHGGVVAMVLDEMIVNLAWVEGIPAVTAHLDVRLKKPVRVGESWLPPPPPVSLFDKSPKSLKKTKKRGKLTPKVSLRCHTSASE